MNALMPTYMGFLLVVFRCGALMMVAPLYGMKAVPQRVRLTLAVSVSLIVFIGAGAPAFPNWTVLSSLLAAGVTETVIGLTAGLAARMILDAANAAGHAISLAMGLGFANVIDPMHGADSTALSEILAMMAVAGAIALGIHRDAIIWLCHSLRDLPPGSAVSIQDVASRVIGEAARAAALSIRLAFPVSAAITFGHIALGLTTRVAPQVSLSSIGFSVAILAGGAGIYVTAPAIAEITARAARTALVGH